MHNFLKKEAVVELPNDSEKIHMDVFFLTSGIITHMDGEQDHNDQNNVPNDSENKQDGSENERQDVPNDSENTGKEEQKSSEPFGNKTKSSEKTEDHSITVREAARLFEESGVPRTERSIINWCNVNRHGKFRLDCYFESNEKKYFITTQSLHAVIKEERRKKGLERKETVEFSEASEQFSEDFRKNNTDTSENTGKVPNDSEGSESDVRKSSEEPEKVPNHSEPQKENGSEQNTEGRQEGNFEEKFNADKELFELNVQVRAKDMMIDQLKNDRTAFREEVTKEREQMIGIIKNQATMIGEKNAQLLALGEGKKEKIRDAEASDTEEPETAQNEHESEQPKQEHQE